MTSLSILLAGAPAPALLQGFGFFRLDWLNILFTVIVVFLGWMVGRLLARWIGADALEIRMANLHSRLLHSLPSLRDFEDQLDESSRALAKFSGDLAGMRGDLVRKGDQTLDLERKLAETETKRRLKDEELDGLRKASTERNRLRRDLDKRISAADQALTDRNGQLDDVKSDMADRDLQVRRPRTNSPGSARRPRPRRRGSRPRERSSPPPRTPCVAPSAAAPPSRSPSPTPSETSRKRGAALRDSTPRRPKPALAGMRPRPKSNARTRPSKPCARPSKMPRTSWRR